MKFLDNLWAWLKKEFTHITVDIDKVAIAVTQQIKLAAENPELGFVAKVFDGLRGAGIAEEVLGVAKLAASKALAIELAILMPTGDVTEQQFLDWEKRVLTALNIAPDKTIVLTRVATSVFRDVQAFTQNGKTVTFAEGVIIVEHAYQSAFN